VRLNARTSIVSAVHLRACGAPVDTLRVSGGVSSRDGEPSPEIVREGWLATRSSLTDAGERRVVDLTGARWNRIAGWLQQVERLRTAA